MLYIVTILFKFFLATISASLNKFDAILFHIRNLNEDIKTSLGIWNEIVNKRDPNQRYITFVLTACYSSILLYSLGFSQFLINQLLFKFNRYVMFTLESPENDDFPYNKFDDFFNWTMTYRLDRLVSFLNCIWRLIAAFFIGISYIYGFIFPYLVIFRNPMVGLVEEKKNCSTLQVTKNLMIIKLPKPDSITILRYFVIFIWNYLTKRNNQS